MHSFLEDKLGEIKLISYFFVNMAHFEASLYQFS